jgi:hypothetical protein
VLPLLQALTLGDKAGIPRETFLSFVDTFYPAKPIQVIKRTGSSSQTRVTVVFVF